MNRTFVNSALALALTFCVTSASYAAAPAAPGAKTTTVSGTTQAKAKLISFHVRNDSATALVLQAGEQQITIEPGKTSNMSLQEGVQIVAVNAAGHLAAGSVLTTVSKDLNGNTLAIN